MGITFVEKVSKLNFDMAKKAVKIIKTIRTNQDRLDNF